MAKWQDISSNKYLVDGKHRRHLFCRDRYHIRACFNPCYSVALMVLRFTTVGDGKHRFFEDLGQ
jgi:hypothetical protein